MILLRNFNRLFTVMRLPQFGDPMIGKIQELELPRNSILHYLPGPVTETGPAQTDPLLAKAEKQISIRHHLTYTHEPIEGSPKLATGTFERDITIYQRVNRNIHRLREEKAIERDERQLLVENYAMLPAAYRYTTNQLSWYYELHNIYATMVNTVAHDLNRFERQNYVLLQVPDVLPSIATLKLFEEKVTVQVLKQFHSDALIRIGDLWTWLGEQRDKSVLSKLPREHLGRMNIVLMYQGKFVNINLGELDFWRIDEQNNPKGLVKAEQMQRRLYLTIVNLATKATEQTEVQIDDSPEHLDHAQAMEVELAVATTDLIDMNASNNAIDDGAIIKEIEEFDKIQLDENQSFEIVKQVAPKEDIADILRPLPMDEALMRHCDDIVATGTMSARDYNRVKEMSGKWKDIKVEDGKRLEDFIKIEPHELVVEPKKMTDAITLLDKTALVTTLPDMTTKYNRHLLKRDIAHVAVAVQRGGFAVNGYEVERIVDAANCVEMHSVKVMTINGKESTLRFTLPVIDDRGYWKANDIVYTMRKQRVDIPIRKTAPDTVTITSFYGKNFIRRSDRSRDNWTKWLTDAIVAKGLDQEDLTVQNMHHASVMDPNVKVPRDYSSIATRLAGFKLQNVTYNFDVQKIPELFTTEEVQDLAQQEMVPVARQGQTLFGMDKFNTVFKHTAGGNITALGTIPELLGMDLGKAPREYSELSMMGKALPLGLVFSYYLGLESFLRTSEIKYDLVDANERVKPEPTDLVLKFSDAKMVIHLSTYEQRLMLNGLNRYAKQMTDYKLEDFNHKDVYLNLIQNDGLTVRYLRELDLMDSMFIDPITHRQLIKMKEPETFKGLLIRANELLTTDQHPDEIDADSMHYYGNQRLAGAVYTELVRAVREYHGKPGMDKKLEMHPNAVWKLISQDGSVAPASDANPIQSIKENSVITYGGEGGRSRRSMVKHTRRFLKQDEGVLSGDVVDNGDVGMTAYLSANPQVGDVDGYLKAEREKTAASLFSSPMLLAPAALYDDGKRWNFVNIQHGSGTASVGAEVSGIRTGEEMLIAHRARDTQAVAAEMDGKVLEVDDVFITVEYSDGKQSSVKKYPLGRTYGRHEGGTFPNDHVANVKLGQKFKQGDILTYNAKHFEPDLITPSQVNWKAGPVLSGFFFESADTLDDSSAIDIHASQMLTTEVTKVKPIFVNFKDSVHNLIKVGSVVTPETILCSIEDPLTADQSVFSEESKASLSEISDRSPKAGVSGTVDKIEVFYNGQLEDMSDSVRDIAKYGDRARKKEAAVSPTTLAQTGQVDSSLRLDSKPVEIDTLVARIYITHASEAIGGDKAVVANQMKTTFKRRMIGVNKTADGRPIHLIFGKKSVDERIVYSVYQIGTAMTYGRLIADGARQLVEQG